MEAERIARALAGTLPLNPVAGSDRLVLYIASKNRRNEPIENFDGWIDRAGSVVLEVCGGMTAYPPATGRWFDDQSRQITQDETVIVYGIIFDLALFERKLAVLRSFIHAYARETEQGEFMFELGTHVFKIDFR